MMKSEPLCRTELRELISTCASERCQKAGHTYSEAVAVAETVGRGIVQTQMGCGQGRGRKRMREVGRLAQIRRKEVLRSGKAQTEWNSVWHSTGHLRTWRQRRGGNYSLHYGLRKPEGGGGAFKCQCKILYVQNGRV